MSQAVWVDETMDTGSADKGSALVTFYTKAVQNPAKSKEQGRPIFDEREFIKIRLSGDNSMVIDKFATDADKEKYPEAWARWQKYQDSRIPGTPIETWSELSEVQIAEFKAINIHTIQQFAALPDSIGQKIMGFNALREKAQAIVNGAQEKAMFAKLKAEADATIRDLRKEIADIRKQMVEQRPAKPVQSVPVVTVTQS